MDGFVHAEVSGSQAGGGQHAYGTGNHAGLVGEDVSENVAGDDDVKLLGISNQLHGSVVHVHMVQSHFGITFRHLGDDPPPQPGAFQDVGFVHAADFLVSLHGHVEGHNGNPPDFILCILLHIKGGQAHGGLLVTLFSEVDAPGQFPDYHDVQPTLDDFGLQGTGVCQFFKEEGGTDVGKEAQFFSQAQQGSFRPFVSRQGIPFPAPHSPQQHCVAGPAAVDGFLRKALAGGIDGCASGQ